MGEGGLGGGGGWGGGVVAEVSDLTFNAVSFGKRDVADCGREGILPREARSAGQRETDRDDDD